MYENIAKQARIAANDLHTRARKDALQHNCRIYSRGFEFLSLDANQERDENLIDYCDRDEMTAKTVQEMANDARKYGSKYLAIGYGVDASECREYYENGDYEPMFDWIDLPNIAL